MARMTGTDWRNLVDRARDKKLLPIVGDQVTGRLLFDNRDLIQAWSDEIGYPVGSSLSMTRLAQYLSIESGNMVAREDYLGFLKRQLVKSAKEDPDRQGALAALDGNSRTLRLAELAGRLHQAILDDDLQNPLRRLAQLPVKIYITTSYHNFLEQTLKSLGKEPRVEICYWDHDLKPKLRPGAGPNPLASIKRKLVERFSMEELHDIAFDLAIDFSDLPGESRRAKARELVQLLDRQERLPELAPVAHRQRPHVPWAKLIDPEAESSEDTLPSVFEVDPAYEPSVDQPLVYHLLGLDALPRSIVISEDDYLDFLVAISADKGIIHQDIKTALSDSSLVLLGYELQGWDFRILFRGLVAHQQRPGRRGLSVAIQLMPATGQSDDASDAYGAQSYLERYFDRANFKIYWGSPGGFVQDLWRQWEEMI